MTLVSESTARKIDALGRVTIPMGLRKRLNLNEGDIVDYFTLNHDNRTYICFSPADKATDPRYAAAAEVLRELNCEVPKELLEKLQNIDGD